LRSLSHLSIGLSNSIFTALPSLLEYHDKLLEFDALTASRSYRGNFAAVQLLVLERSMSKYASRCITCRQKVSRIVAKSTPHFRSWERDGERFSTLPKIECGVVSLFPRSWIASNLDNFFARDNNDDYRETWPFRYFKKTSRISANESFFSLENKFLLDKSQK